MTGKHMYLFRDLPEVLHVERDHVLFRRGESASSMFVVVEGMVDLMLGGSVVESAHSGAFVGELALIDNAPRSATAVARAGARVFPIDQDRFRSLVQQSPQFALDVMHAMAQRLRRTNARLSATKTVRGAKKGAPRKRGASARSARRR